MYALIHVNDIQVKFDTHCERMPDGRLIVPFSQLKMLGSVANMQVVATARELKAMIAEQKESGIYDIPTILPELGGELVGDNQLEEDDTSEDQTETENTDGEVTENVDEGFLKPFETEDGDLNNTEDGITE